MSDIYSYFFALLFIISFRDALTRDDHLKCVRDRLLMEHSSSMIHPAMDARARNDPREREQAASLFFASSAYFILSDDRKTERKRD